MIHYSIDRWLVPPKPKPPPRSLLGKLFALCPYQLSRPYVKNNYVYLIFLTFFMLINIGLFVSRSIEYRSHNGFVIVARACGKFQDICSYMCDYLGIGRGGVSKNSAYTFDSGSDSQPYEYEPNTLLSKLQGPLNENHIHTNTSQVVVI